MKKELGRAYEAHWNTHSIRNGITERRKINSRLFRFTMVASRWGCRASLYITPCLAYSCSCDLTQSDVKVKPEIVRLK